MRVFWMLLMILTLGLLGVSVSGCDQGAEETGGSGVGEAGDESGDTLAEPGDRIGGAVEDRSAEASDDTN